MFNPASTLRHNLNGFVPGSLRQHCGYFAVDLVSQRCVVSPDPNLNLRLGSGSPDQSPALAFNFSFAFGNCLLKRRQLESGQHFLPAGKTGIDPFLYIGTNSGKISLIFCRFPAAPD